MLVWKRCAASLRLAVIGLTALAAVGCEDGEFKPMYERQAFVTDMAGNATSLCGTPGSDDPSEMGVRSFETEFKLRVEDQELMTRRIDVKWRLTHALQEPVFYTINDDGGPIGADICDEVALNKAVSTDDFGFLLAIHESHEHPDDASVVDGTELHFFFYLPMRLSTPKAEPPAEYFLAIVPFVVPVNGCVGDADIVAQCVAATKIHDLLKKKPLAAEFSKLVWDNRVALFSLLHRRGGGDQVKIRGHNGVIHGSLK
jgi:hypothetical protein